MIVVSSLWSFFVDDIIGKRVVSLEYEAYEEMAIQELRNLCQKVS